MTTRSYFHTAFFFGALCSAGCGSSTVQAPAPVAPAPPEPTRTAWPTPAAPESSGDAIVHAELETSAQAVEPGGKFLLAVRFQIPADYRISWTNPGDVGQSTHVAFEVPEGFVVGALLFPAPKRFELPGKLVSYGYERETAVFAEVTAPAKLSESQVLRFEVKADWLACKDECASEELGAWFELVSRRRAPEPQLPEDLDAYYSALPKAFDALPEASHDWKVTRGKPALTLSAPDVKWLDFFPSDPEQPKLLGVDRKGEALYVKFAQAAASGQLRGLAVGEVEGKLASFDVEVPWPSP
jgi:DsbC/DsbD-like thiol-disulfide interchange protein